MRTISRELADTVVRSEVALLFDYPSLWSLEIQPHVENGFNYWEMAERFATVLAGMGVQIDMVRAGEDLSLYKIVMAPSQHICAKQTAESLERFVKAGGALILGPRSGVKDEHNAVVETFLPGCLRGLAGCSVEDYDAFSAIPGFTMQVKDAGGNEYEALGLAEVLVTEENARSILSYTKRYYAGRSAAVEHPYGSGRCLYLGTVLGEEGLEALLSRILEETEVSYQKQLPLALEVAFRERDGQRYRFYLNHGTSPVSLAPIKAGTDLLSGQSVEDEMVIRQLDLMIVKER
jgi:beta-galactosidase